MVEGLCQIRLVSHSDLKLLDGAFQLVGPFKQLSELVVRECVIQLQPYCLFKGLLRLRVSVVAQPNGSQVILETGITRFASNSARQNLLRFAVPAFVSQRGRIEEKGAHRARVKLKGPVQALTCVCIAM